MSVMTYQEIALNWTPQSRRDHTFNIIALFILTGFMTAGLLLGSIELPKTERKVKLEVPERVAKFIMEKPKPKPQKIEPPKPKPKPKSRVQRQQPKNEVILTKKQEVARKKAEQSGLLALSNELADLVDTSSIDNMVGKKVTTSAQSHQAAQINTDALGKDIGKSSQGVNSGNYLAKIGKTTLSTQERAIARKLITSRAVKGDSHRNNKAISDQKARVGNYRSEEDIAYVMDLNKSKLHSLYRRARRTNPGLKGKIVLEITIQASGKVSAVKIKSSELNDPTLESKLLARIRQFDFGLQNVKTVTVTFPVEFLPS